MKTVVRARSIGILTLFLLSIENVLALSTGLSPLDTAFNTIGNLFSINALQNEQVAVGVARFLWFILIFAVLNWSGRNYVFKGDDGTNKKTANIVALVLAAISVFFVPMNVILAGTSGWGVILWSVLLLAPALVAVKFAFGGKKEKSAGDHIVDFVILLFALLWTWLMMGTLLEWYREQFPQTANSIDSVVGVAWLVLFFALLWKFFQIIGASGGSLGKAGSGIGNLFNRSGNGTNTPKSQNRNQEESPTKNSSESNDSQKPPAALSKVSQTPVSDGLKLSWTHSPAEEQVEFYYVEKAPVSDKLRKEFFAKSKEERLKFLQQFQRYTNKLRNSHMIGEWVGVAKTTENQHLEKGISKENTLTISGNDTGKKMFIYTVRAIKKGSSGPRALAIESEQMEQIKPKPTPKPVPEGNWSYDVPGNQGPLRQINPADNSQEHKRGIFLTFAGDYKGGKLQMETILQGKSQLFPYQDISSGRFALEISGGQDRKIYFADRKIDRADVKAYDEQGNPIERWGKVENNTLLLRGSKLYIVYAHITLKKEDTKSLPKPEQKNNGHDRKRVAKLINEYVKDLQREMNDYGRDTPWKWETRKTNNKHKEIIRLMDNAENKRYIDVQITSMKNALMQTPQTRSYAGYFEDIIKHFFYGSEGANIEDKDINIDMVNTALKRFIELSDIKNHGGQ